MYICEYVCVYIYIYTFVINAHQYFTFYINGLCFKRFKNFYVVFVPKKYTLTL